MQRVLKLNGLNASLDVKRRQAKASVQTYDVLVYGLEVLTIYRRRIGALGQYERIELGRLNKRGRALTKIMRIAVRALYCLGLDLARVTLEASTAHQGYSIIAVRPSPRVTEEEETLLAEAIVGEHRAQVTDHAQAMIGMDLEFLLCRADGKVVSAAQYLERHGQAGYDGINVHGKAVYPLVELRPKPDTEPKLIFRNLMATMRAAAKNINNAELSWLAGGMPKQGFCLGGHIHLSNIPLTTRLLKALDNYLALPLVMIEPASSRRRRPRYGFLGDYRHQFHGGFEYRTLPSWIVSPVVAKGVIALVRLIADHHEQLTQTPLNQEKYQSYFYNGSSINLYSIVHTLWSDLESTSSYERYRHHLNPLKQLIIKHEPWQETEDIRKAWHIHQQEREDVMRFID